MTVIYCVSTQSIWKLSQGVLRFVLLYRLVFLNTIEFRQIEKCIVMGFGLVACNCYHCLDFPIVSRVNSVKNFVFLRYTGLPKLFLKIITWFYFCQPKIQQFNSVFFLNVIVV